MAQEHDVPRQTPQDRVLGRVVHGMKLGPPPYLTAVERTELSKVLVDVPKLAMAGADDTAKDLRHHLLKVGCSR